MRDNTLINDFIALFKFMEDMAQIRYDFVISQISSFKKKAQLPDMLALKYYQAILLEIKNKEYNVFSEKIFVSSSKKLAIFKKASDYLNE